MIEPEQCPICGSKYFHKRGRTIKGDKVRYQCKKCRHNFYQPPTIPRIFDGNKPLCPWCKNNNVTKEGMNRYKTQQKYFCKNCMKIFQVLIGTNCYCPKHAIRPSHARYVKEDVFYLHELYLKETGKTNDFVRWLQSKTNVMKLEEKRNTDLIVHIQKSDLGLKKGRIIYIAAKSPYEEEVFFDVNERKLIKLFFKFIKGKKWHRIVMYDRNMWLYLELKCNIYGIKPVHSRSKKMLLESMIREGKRNITRKIFALFKEFDLMSLDAKSVPQEDKVYEQLYKKIAFLKSKPRLTQSHIEKLYEMPRSEKFNFLALSEVRMLYNLYYQIRLSDMI